jgi:hypothetical protein
VLKNIAILINLVIVPYNKKAPNERKDGKIIGKDHRQTAVSLRLFSAQAMRLVNKMAITFSASLCPLPNIILCQPPGLDKHIAT